MEDVESKYPIYLIQDQGCMEQHDDEDIMYSIQDQQRVTGEADPKLDNSTTVLKCYANTPTIPPDLDRTPKLCSVEGYVNRLHEHTSQRENRLIQGKITEDDIRQEFKDTFQGLGQIPGAVQLDVKDDAKPQQDPPRCMPIPLKKELKILLQYNRPHAPEIFWSKLQEALGDLPEVGIVADDILMYGQGQTETETPINHDENLLQLIQ
ncbi:hypothetical protein PR048_015323 [Dryococelus australis]|uniref:Uncharacterized protein n=1 Tax=Dryococelus australis TaxID=614101 RepID=A0ABQ9HGW3_9NEOP|nr:hypothetical protein PR048_015323 [Dryococelus australis]